jgi:hypothetical protein
MSVQRVFWIKQTLKQLDEAAYSGNIGVMELFKFHQKASQKQKDVLQSHIKNKKHKEAWKLVQDVTGVKLHKSVSEAVSPDILPKAGAGAWGTDTLKKSYQRDTPGQSDKRIASFSKWMNTK